MIWFFNLHLLSYNFFVCLLGFMRFRLILVFCWFIILFKFSFAFFFLIDNFVIVSQLFTLVCFNTWYIDGYMTPYPHRSINFGVRSAAPVHVLHRYLQCRKIVTHTSVCVIVPLGTPLETLMHSNRVTGVGVY